MKNGKYPVPCAKERGLGIVNSDITDGELLVAEPKTVLSAVEGEVTHHSTASILKTCMSNL